MGDLSVKTKYLLMATATVAAFAAPAQAATKHVTKHKKTTRHVVHRAEPSRVSEEIAALRAEVADLRQRLSEQSAGSATVQAQIATAQAQAADARATAAAAQEQAAAATQQLATAQADIGKRFAKAEHPDKIPFKGITITPGGFVELAAIYRDRNQQSDIATRWQDLPFRNTGLARTHEGRFTARQSRVQFLAEGDASKTVHLAMFGEFDFQGAARTANSNESNSYNPRIRNLYGTIDWKTSGGNGVHLLAGQNWSLATMNSKGITPRNETPPPTIEAQYVPGFVWARQPQVRLTYDTFDHQLWFAVSAENPQTTFFGTTTFPGRTVTFNAPGSGLFDANNNFSINHFPDVIGKAALETKVEGRTLHLEAFGIYRDFYQRIQLTGQPGANRGDHGYGVGGGGFVQLFPGVLDLQGSFLTGVGLGRYGSAQLPDVTFRPDGTISPIREYMVLVGATVHPTKMLDVYVFAGREKQRARAYPGGFGLGNPLLVNTNCDIEGGACPANTKELQQITGGVWQRLYQGSWGRVQVGAQYIYTERDTLAGLNGVAPTAKQNMGLLSFRYYPF